MTVKTYPLLINLLFMLVSWAMGIYFLSVIYSPTIIIPLFNEYFWMRDDTGMLGLTAIFTALTIPLISYLYIKRNNILKKKTWYSISVVNQLFWLGTIAIQLKTWAFNLGICH